MEEEELASLSAKRDNQEAMQGATALLVWGCGLIQGEMQHHREFNRDAREERTTDDLPTCPCLYMKHERRGQREPGRK